MAGVHVDMGDKDLLLIDDDQELGELLTDYLRREGFDVTVTTDGRQGLARAAALRPSLVLLDVMLPDLDGFQVLQRLRTETTVPVIMLTAKGEEIDRIVGLEMGADDYLPKPFNPRELVARIKAVLRRTQVDSGAASLDADRAVAPAPQAPESSPGPSSKEPSALVCGDLYLDLDGYRVLLGGQEIMLTAIEFALLRELMGAPGRVLSRDTLLDRIRGREFESFDRSIDVHISHLRRKLADNPQKPRFIKTVRSVGYVFVGRESS